MESLNDVGSITYFNADGSIHETVTFNNQERYLEEAKEALKTRGITGWKCNTLSKDLNLHYELYKMIADEVDDDAMSRGEYARQHPELQKTEEIERTTQAAIRTDSKYQQAEQRRPKVSNLTNAIKEKISITEYAAMLGYHVKQISSDRYTLLEHDSMAIKFDKSGMEYFIWNSRGIGGIIRTDKQEESVYNQIAGKGYHINKAQREELAVLLRNYYLREFISAEIYTLEKELKQDVKLRKKIEKKPELFQKELQRRLLPHSMEFFPSFAVQNGTYRSTMMLKNFPFEIGSCCLLQTACMRGTSFMMRLTPMNGREIKKLTEKQMNKSSYKRSSTQATDQLEGLSEQTALAEFYQAVSNSQTTLFFVSVYIECYGRNEEDLQSTIRAVEEKLITANISAERLIRQQREGFLSVSPLGRDYFLADANNFPSQTVAACYPCSYSSRLDLHGMFLGYTMSGGNFFLDILQRQANVTNSSFCIIGAAGQGKSWLMKKIITFLRMFGVRSFSLDPENEYVDLTKNLNGTIYNCIDGKAKINPLEVRCLRRDDDDEDDKYVSELNNLPIFFQHMSWLKDFFRVLLPGISDKEVTALMILVQEMYKAHGIDGNTDFSVLGPEDYPILSDLYLFIEPMMGKGYKMIEANIIDTLLLYLKSCHDGELSLVFNGHTNIKNADMINFSLLELLEGSKDRTQAVLFNLATWIWSQIALRRWKILFNMDELYLFLENQFMVRWICSCVKRVRKYQALVGVATQQLADCLRPDIATYTTALFNNSAYKFLFYPGEIDLPKVKDQLDLKAGEIEKIRNPNQKHCLVKAGDDKYYIQVGSLPYENELFGKAGG